MKASLVTFIPAVVGLVAGCTNTAPTEAQGATTSNIIGDGDDRTTPTLAEREGKYVRLDEDGTPIAITVVEMSIHQIRFDLRAEHARADERASLSGAEGTISNVGVGTYESGDCTLVFNIGDDGRRAPTLYVVQSGACASVGFGAAANVGGKYTKK